MVYLLEKKERKGEEKTGATVRQSARFAILKKLQQMKRKICSMLILLSLERQMYRCGFALNEYSKLYINLDFFLINSVLQSVFMQMAVLIQVGIWSHITSNRSALFKILLYIPSNHITSSKGLRCVLGYINVALSIFKLVLK